MVIKNNFELKEYNTYRISAICSKAFFPETDEDIISLFSEPVAQKRIIIGSGANIILSKSTYEEEFIIFKENFSDVTIQDDLIKAQAGITLQKLSETALENALTGLEIFYDIPSSLGGAVVMNAGASGEEIKDLLTEVKFFDPISKEVKVLPRELIGFEYRNSFFQKNPHLIVLEASLQLKQGTKDLIEDKMMRTKAARWAKQPKEYPNAGSVFKRPSGMYVGPMIEELGLKGFAIGGAKVSEKHAGFIVNFNGATGNDILSLISYIKADVKKNYQVDLEPEQRII